MINESKPTSAFSNSTKVNIGETWDSDPYTWNLEPRTWDMLASLITNSERQYNLIWDIWIIAWQDGDRVWDDLGNQLIINQAKP